MRGVKRQTFIKRLYKRIVRDCSALGWFIARTVPPFRPIYETRGTATPITVTVWFYQKVLGINRDAYWPVHFTSLINGARNVYCGIGSAPGDSGGCYIQAIGKVYVGDYTQLAPNVGIISANHDPYDNSKHIPSEVRIGSYCWIGMNAIVLPGVTLGDFTIVGAGSVVTKSYEDGYCIVAGNPARIVRTLDREKCVRFRNPYEYHGYIRREKFEAFRRNYLNV